MRACGPRWSNAWAGFPGEACEWGRIVEQTPRGVILRECVGYDEALWPAAEAIELRLRHGYVVK
ncbi:MAG: hypothetical protein ACOYZ7_14930 [Chloroflexota bacterium]